MLRSNNHRLYYGQTHILHHNGDIGYNDIKENSSDINLIIERLLSLRSSYWSGEYSEAVLATAGSRILEFSDIFNLSGFTNANGIVTVPFSSIWSISIYAETRFSANSVTQGQVEYVLYKNGGIVTEYLPLTHYDTGQTGQNRVTVSGTRVWELALESGENVHIQQILPAGVETDEVRIEMNIKGNNINAAVLQI